MPQTACATIATATSFSPCSSPAPTADRREAARAVSEQQQQDGRGQGEAGPRRQAAQIAGAHEAEREPDLAGRRAREELAEADKVGVGVLVQPAAPLDKFGAEIADMRDRPAEAAYPHFRESEQDLERRPGLPPPLLDGRHTSRHGGCVLSHLLRRRAARNATLAYHPASLTALTGTAVAW